MGPGQAGGAQERQRALLHPFADQRPERFAVGDRIDAKDLALPEGAELVDAPETCIVSFHYLHGTGEDGADGAEGADEAGNEPEVIGEKKDDDG